MRGFGYSLGLLILTTRIVWPAHAQEANDPEKNFEKLWNAYDANYALFDVKPVDWRALYHVYRPQVTSETTDDELFSIMSSMLGHLNDNHVMLTSQDPERFFDAGYLGEMFGDRGGGAFREYLSQRPAPDGYFGKALEEIGEGVFAFGWAADDIGYFHFRGFGDIEASGKAIDRIIDELKNARGMIVDVRRNGGGDDRVGKLIADRFADRKRLYMTTQIRNGPGYGDFTPPRYWYVEPGGPTRFTKPVILLMDRTSISAAENFALAMRVLPHVTVIGDFSSGCFADMYRDRLPNGWGFSVSYKLFLDHTGFCWEGIGVPPDIRQIRTEEDTAEGRDRVLELAVSLLSSGKLARQDENAGLHDFRESLARNLADDIETRGLESALESYRQAKAGDPDVYYIDVDELQMVSGELREAGKDEASTEVLRIAAEEFPDMPLILYSLGAAYLREGQEAKAWETYERAIDLNLRRRTSEANAYYAMVITKTLWTDGFDRMAERYRELRQEHPLEIGEALLNDLGYEMLSVGRTRDAIDIFTLNVTTFPDYANGYDSLGEAYMEAGFTDQAIHNYERSLRLDPENANAAEILRALRAGEKPGE